MNQVEFNLLDEPWIRVRDAACRVQEVSLADALLRAQEFTDLAGEMPTQDAAVLRLLLAGGRTVVPKERLLVKIWGPESDAEDNNVEAYVSLLRKKLAYLGSAVTIETIRKVGYRLGGLS